VLHTRIACLAVGLMSVATIQAPTVYPSPKDVTLTLAQNGVRAGAIMSLTDFVNGEAERGGSRPLPSVPTAPATGAAIDSTLTGFGQGHPEFLIQRTRTNVRLIRRDAPAELMQTLTLQGVAQGREQVSISAALNEVVGSLIKQRPISGVLGSGVMPGPGCPFGAPIRVSAGQVTPLDAMDNLVSQVPGLSWFVLYDADRAQEPVHIGLWCQDGSSFRLQLPG
jgi:hypothetical protein